MSICPSREARYVPWTFGETFECVKCHRRLRQDHRLRSRCGEGYDAIYPMPEHQVAEAVWDGA